MSRESFAQEIKDDFRNMFFRIARKEGLTITKIARRLTEALDAEEVKVFNSDGIVVYSDPLIAHRIRLDAVKIAGEYFGLKATEKVDANISGVITVKAFGEDD